MTIDEMLDKVAQNLGVEKKTSQTAAVPKKSAKTEKPELNAKEMSTLQINNNASAPEKKCKCGGDGCKKHECKHSNNSSFDKLTLSCAKRLVEGLEKAAEELGVKVVMAIVNEGGNLMCLHAMDDSYIASIEASKEKAFTSVALKMPTHEALKESRGGSLDGYTNGNGILLLGGGFPLVKNGKIYGALGVSGGTKEQDILLAKIGAEVFKIF